MDLLPRFAFRTLLHVSHSAQAQTTIAWFAIVETKEGRDLCAAVGLRQVEGLWCIAWCTLAPQRAAWTYQFGLLQSLADYAWVRKGDPTPARALLDASYFRQYWRPTVNFQVLPDARFSCQRSTDCCKHDFEISLPAEAQLIVDAMPWEQIAPHLAGTQLPVRDDGMLQLKALNETCRFLGVHGQCLIHGELGRQPFGPCAVFPISFAQTPDGVAVAASPICGGVRLGLGVPLSGRRDDLHERLAHLQPRQPDGFRLSPGVEISWERFRAVERSLCECLAAPDLPMRRRLVTGSRLLGALSNHEPVEPQRWLRESIPPIDPGLRTELRAMLARTLRWNREVLQSLGPDLPEELSDIEAKEPKILAQVLQNTLFCKVYSYPLDLTSAYNLLIVLYLLALTMQVRAAGPLSVLMWRELGSLGVHGLLRSLLHEGAPEGFRSLFGTADFGIWLLAV